MIDWSPIFLTFQLAAMTTAILFVMSLPISYWLAFSKNKFKPVIEAMISMPLVLPPTVIGFYLLIAFSPNNFFGNWVEHILGIRLVFTFHGLVFASLIYSMPFMVYPIQSGLSNLDPKIREASMLLGKSDFTTFFRVLLPNIKTSVISGIVLAFAHTIGEFGIVLMIGGNIPDKTRVASIAIYDQVEMMNYSQAHIYSIILFAFAFTILLSVYMINNGFLKKLWK